MIIKITVKNKIAMLAAPAAIVCGNSDYIIQFDFDDEWAGYETKTARFIIGGKYTDVVFSGDTVNMPIVYNTRMVAVGVFAGDLRTTTPALILAHRGILDGTGSPAAPDADVYNAIMQALNDRIPEPSKDGTAGQVLATNGSGGRYWTDQTGGGGLAVPEPSKDGSLLVGNADSYPNNGKWTEADAAGGYGYKKVSQPAFDITWDGDATGKVVIDTEEMRLVKVSDEILTVEQVSGATDVMMSDGGEQIVTVDQSQIMDIGIGFGVIGGS